jgi:hypothetical protein
MAAVYTCETMARRPDDGGIRNSEMSTSARLYGAMSQKAATFIINIQIRSRKDVERTDRGLL